MTQTTFEINDKGLLQKQITRFETKYFPLKYEYIPKQILAEHIPAVLPYFGTHFPECRECDELLTCAGLALELKVNLSRAKDFRKRQKKVVQQLPSGGS